MHNPRLAFVITVILIVYTIIILYICYNMYRIIHTGLKRLGEQRALLRAHPGGLRGRLAERRLRDVSHAGPGASKAVNKGLKLGESLAGHGGGDLNAMRICHRV